MEHGDAARGGARPLVVRVPVEPVEAAVEADALDAVARTGNLVVRGPLFGVAAQEDGDGHVWRVIVAVTLGCPQQARDSLNSRLWFRAKDDAEDTAERRALLAAVARLETEYVDDLGVAGTRYRIVRAEEYAAVGALGEMEGPRPTDAEPLVPDWSRGARGPAVDDGLVLDPSAPVTPTQVAERLALRDLCYSGDRFPQDVLADSRGAVTTHPDILLLPPTFTVVERTANAWAPISGPHATAHTARRSLDFSLTWAWPRMRGLIPVDGPMEADARTETEGRADGDGTARTPGPLAAYAEAAAALRVGRVNRLEFQDTVYQIARTRRLLRWGPDGPEGPRPSDVNTQQPTRIHPLLDEDGHIVSGD
ncbi:DUF5954 family protein [Streptomyces sp. NPDC056132]|uniref:DUF5954 family protein n=1 Tax=Streptomyces sp. NPDC056132 TaxID=3345722 RepID=UPI0035DC1999